MNCPKVWCGAVLDEEPLGYYCPHCGGYYSESGGSLGRIGDIVVRTDLDLKTALDGDGKRFIIWDPEDGEPLKGKDGTIVSEGVVGRLRSDSIHLRRVQYAEGVPVEFGTRRWPCRPEELQIGDWTEATFRLAGSEGKLQIWRVA